MPGFPTRSSSTPERHRYTFNLGLTPRRVGRGGPASSCRSPHYLRIVRAIMLKGSTLADLHFDTLALAGLMLIAMTIAITRFRRTLD